MCGGVVYQVQRALYNMAEFEHGHPEPGSASFSSSVPTILNQLGVPTLSEIMCKRKVCVYNPPHIGARKTKPRYSTNSKGVSISERVIEFSMSIIRSFLSIFGRCFEQ